eukprot:m.219135 g.219135  ORF g.219135 m.219135 type:complete len:70 (+) comp39920_c0_seq7:102-311(+)
MSSLTLSIKLSDFHSVEVALYLYQFLLILSLISEMSSFGKAFGQACSQKGEGQQTIQVHEMQVTAESGT